ncbi:MAG: hypothetical protein KAH23_02370 [Kiritimatiellae bacterium]|nr:hypothetical protein [Kiritimatiellia bacterium]
MKKIHLLNIDWGVIVLLVIFYIIALLLIPLGRFSEWIPPQAHSGYYSITQIDPADDTRLHSYVRSMFIDGDIDFFNEIGYIFRFRTTPTGYTYNRTYSLGSAILWLPFFLVGHLLTLFSNALGLSFSPNGYSPPYLIMTGIGSACYVFAGLLLLYDLLRDYFSKSISLLAVNVLWFSTHLPYYAFIRSRMGHANEFFIICLYIYTWLRLRTQTPRLLSGIWLGGICGLMTLIRVDDSLLIFLYASDCLYMIIRDYKRENITLVKRRAIEIVAFTLTFLTVFSIAFTAAHVLWGSFTLVGDNFAYGNSPLEILLNFSHILSPTQIWKIFMSYDKGIFLSAPIYICAMAGLVMWIDKRHILRLLIIAGACIPLGLCIVNASTGCDYGIRRLTGAIPFLVFGLAAFYEKTLTFRSGKILIAVISFIIPMLSYIQLMHYKVLLRFDDPLFIVKSLQNIPYLFTSGCQYLLRSSCWPKLVWLEQARLNTATDILFMIGIPALLLSGLCVVVVIHHRIKHIMTCFNTSRHPSIKWLSIAMLIVPLLLNLLLYLGNPPKRHTSVIERNTYTDKIKAYQNQTGKTLVYADTAKIEQALAAFETEEKLRKEQKQNLSE